MERNQFTSLIRPATRGVALILGLFTLLNIVGSLRVSGFDANIWWIDLNFLPRAVGAIYLVIAAASLIGFSAGWLANTTLRRAASAIIGTLAAVALWNAIWFYQLWREGHISPGVPVPFSLPAGLLLGLIAVSTLRSVRRINCRQRVAFVSAVLCAAIVFPLAQMYCFGKTDYRRRADAIVVFGARTYADGTPSFVLADRTRTAVALYQQGLAPQLIFSGGPGDGATSEPQAMRNMALAMGVPASAITLDEHGLTTDLTVSDTVPIFKTRHLTKVIAVSHFYHLPRVKMAYTRALSADRFNVEIVTVPAQDEQPLRAMPWYIAREIPALWTYYLRPLF